MQQEPASRVKMFLALEMDRKTVFEQHDKLIINIAFLRI